MSVADIYPRAFFALRTDVRQNAHYITDFEIIFPAGSVIILQNHYEKRLRLLNLHEKSVFLELIEISPSRKLIAIIQNGVKGQIVIYDLATLKKRKTLNLPSNSTTKRFENICFTQDGVFILAITGQPEWNLLLYRWETGKLLSSIKAINTSHPATIVQICASPTDSADVCLVGQGLFRLLYRTKSVWKQYGFQKADLINITSAAWLTSHRILCGTMDGKLFIVDDGELKNIYNAFSVNTISLNEKDDIGVSSSLMLIKNPADGQEHDNVAVRAITAFSKGFAYSCKSGYVHLFEKDTPDKYKRRNVFRIIDVDLKHLPQLELNTVKHISINISKDRLLVTTNRTQLYTAHLWDSDIVGETEIPFKHLGVPLHHGPVNGLAMCMWKPFFATSGKLDRTVRLWNYNMDIIQIIKHYSEEILCIDLHPTGNFIAIGFHEKVDISIILLNDIQLLRSLQIKECEFIQFSAYGHYLAAIKQEVIEIFGTILFSSVLTLKGHLGKVNAVQWILDDKQLASCSTQGEIFIWEIVSGAIIREVQVPDVSFCDIAVSSDGSTVFAIDSEGLLNKFSNLNLSMSHKFHKISLEKIILSRSNHMMYMTGNNSSIVAVKLPLANPPEFSDYQFHMSRIQQLKLSYDDLTLVTISVQGAVIIWKVNVSEGSMLPLDKNFMHLTESLINKTELENKILEIKNLSQKLRELELMQMKELRGIEATYCEKMKEMHKNYMQTVRQLKDKIELMETNQNKQLMDIKTEVDKLREKQKEEKQDMIENFKNKLLMKKQKIRSLEVLNHETINDFENRVTELEKSKKEETDDLIKNYEEKLTQAETLLKQSHQQNAENIVKQDEAKRLIEEDADREIVETTAKYEGLLRGEKEQNVTLKEETLILNKKYMEAQRERDAVRQKLQKLQKDLQKYRSSVQDLEKYLKDLKIEVVDRDSAIEEKKEKMFLLKSQIQESEKFKFILEYKITELRKEIDPKDCEIKEKEEQIADMETEIENFEKLNSSLELQLIELKEKINGTEIDVSSYEKMYQSRTIAVRQIKVDIYALYQNLRNYKKLRDDIKALNHKYQKCDIDDQEKLGTSDVQKDLLVQRMFLERTIKSLRNVLEKSKQNKTDKAKVVQDNVVLLEELNFVRKELTVATIKIKNLENLIAAKPKKSTAPSEAYNKLKETLEKHETIKRTYQVVIDGANRETDNLNTKINVMKEKFRALLQSTESQ